MDSRSIEAGHLTRIHDSVLADPERRILGVIVARMPSWVMPDHMTAIGVLGGAMVGAGCLLAHLDTSWLLLSIAGLLVNWFGDSTDGSLARFRGIERPRYGFFVDQFADVMAHFLMLFGLGLSPLMRFDVALMALLGSLLIMFYGHLKLQFSRSWQVSHHGVGPTELRLLIAAGLIWAMLAPLPSIELGATSLSLFDVVAIAVFIGALMAIGLMFIGDRTKLSVIDPPRGGIPAEVRVTPIDRRYNDA